MKHAILFRKQVMNNTAQLQHQSNASKSLQNNNRICDDKFNPKQLLQEDDSTNGVNERINGFNNGWIDVNIAPDTDTFDNLKEEMEIAFGGECDDSADEYEDNDPDASILFNYKEKSFKEDDISDFDVTSKIIITVPDDMRERKCDACRKRFMLKESFEQHLKECIELKLVKFITEGHQLLIMRKSRTLSANEFVRRIIFSLKKTVKLLALCYKEVSDVTSTVNLDDKITKKLNLFDIAGDADKINFGPLKKYLNNRTDSPPLLNSITTNEQTANNIEQNNRNFLKLLEGKPNILIQKNRFNSDGGVDFNGCNSRPSSLTFENQHSSTLVGDRQNENHFGRRQSASVSPFQSTIFSTTDRSCTTISCVDLESTILMQQQNTKRMPIIETVIAQCSPCGESFTSLQQFENHTRQFHNIPKSSMDRSNSSTPQPNGELKLPLSMNLPLGMKSDALNADERNKLLQMLATSSLQF